MSRVSRKERSARGRYFGSQSLRKHRVAGKTSAIDKRAADDGKRSRNKNVLLIIKAFFYGSKQQFLNRQIYYCIQFAIYGKLRDSSQHLPSLFFIKCPFVLASK